MSDYDQIATALSAFQSECPTIPKKSTANLGKYKFDYADLETVLSVIREPMAKHGLSWTSECGFPQTISYTDVRETQRGEIVANKVDAIVLTITVRLFHVSGQSFAHAVSIPIKLDSPQSMGIAMTYGRRYGLMSVLGLATEDNDIAGIEPQRDRQRPRQASGNAKSAAQPPKPKSPPNPMEGTVTQVNANGFSVTDSTGTVYFRSESDDIKYAATHAHKTGSVVSCKWTCNQAGAYFATTLNVAAPEPGEIETEENKMIAEIAILSVDEQFVTASTGDKLFAVDTSNGRFFAMHEIAKTLRELAGTGEAIEVAYVEKSGGKARLITEIRKGNG